MTRKQAIEEAIFIISLQKIEGIKKQEIITQLESCKEDLPFTHWTRASILDACDQHILDTGKPLTVSDFTNDRKLPSHPVIQLHFNMTAREFRDAYYPLGPSVKSLPKFKIDYTKRKSKYMKMPLEEVNDTFIAEFNEKKIVGMRHYNRVRAEGHPSYQTLMRLNSAKTWNELLNKLGLSTYCGYVKTSVSVGFEDGTEV
ncbi:MAG: hypothetical protein KH138_11400 [Firmicutes bacterium]|nr:hypothetical protein [Bacillota bacterium]